MKKIEDVIWDAQGRVPVIVQDAGSGAVLALDTMDRKALGVTLSTGRATYWVPEDGTAATCAASGPLQMVTAVCLACDGRSILLRVQSAGPLCETGAATCFEASLSAASAAARGAGARETAGDSAPIQWSSEAAQGA